MKIVEFVCDFGSSFWTLGKHSLVRQNHRSLLDWELQGHMREEGMFDPKKIFVDPVVKFKEDIEIVK